MSLVSAAALFSGLHAQAVAAEQQAPRTVALLDRLDEFLVARCLTPAAGQALQEVVASGALRPVLQGNFTLKNVDLSADKIVVQIEDRVQRSYGITLALAGEQSGKPDGQGRHFAFYLIGSPGPPNPQATAALLAAASLFDQAIPDTALARCSGGGAAPRTEDRRYPRALVLASASVEVLILLAAVVFGLRAVHARTAGSAGHFH